MALPPCFDMGAHVPQDEHGGLAVELGSRLQAVQAHARASVHRTQALRLAWTPPRLARARVPAPTVGAILDASVRLLDV